MIIKAFSDHIKSFNSEIPPVILLSRWLELKLSKKPKDNIENIIHAELGLLVNPQGFFIVAAKSQTGKNLLKSLYNFAISYEQHKFNQWLHELKANDFK